MSTKNVRRPGRPTVDSDLLRFRADRSLVDAIDVFAATETDKPSRPEAIRRLLRDHLVGLGLMRAGE